MIASFERATPADAESLLAVQIAAFENDAVIYAGVAVGGPPGYRQLYVTYEQILNDAYYKIVADGRIIGGIVVAAISAVHIHLGILFIAPAYHNRGIGSAALRHVEAAHPAPRWTLNTPDYAVRNHRFYEKHGYVRTGQRPFRDFALIDYEKRFAPLRG